MNSKKITVRFTIKGDAPAEKLREIVEQSGLLIICWRLAGGMRPRDLGTADRCPAHSLPSQGNAVAAGQPQRRLGDLRRPPGGLQRCGRPPGRPGSGPIAA